MDIEENLKVPVEQLKRGDFILCQATREEWFAVVDEVINDRIVELLEVNIEESFVGTGVTYVNTDCYKRLATEEEKNNILEFLKVEYNYNLHFNDNGDLILDDWKPELWQNYFAPVFNNKTFSFETKLFLCGEDSELDEIFRSKNMMFYSKVAASYKLDDVNKVLKKFFHF